MAYSRREVEDYLRARGATRIVLDHSCDALVGIQDNGIGSIIRYTGALPPQYLTPLPPHCRYCSKPVPTERCDSCGAPL